MLHTIPGDYATALLLGGEPGEAYDASAEQFEKIREQLGLQGSLPQQYARWLGNFFQGDFGTSWTNRKPVWDRMAPRIFLSFELGVLAVSLAMVLGTVGGVISAVRQDTWVDYLLRGTSMTMQAMPGFWVALMVIAALVAIWGWKPPIEYRHLWDDPVRNISVLLLPAFLVGLRSSAEILRMTRSSVLEVLREDYVRTAEAKGLYRSKILGQHVLRNALLPVSTLAGFEVVFLMSGQVIIEQVFNLHGIGKLFIQGVAARDYPVVQAIVMFVALVVLLANLVVDVMYAWLDPRIRYN
ncbi:Putative peptide transport system permease protein BMEII0209 [Geodia barretti]|uniref:Peptide transport system permease protein BMEII0209 n=1 Tax=Geodia barretti TaxID=519541 RepID=A0AA35RJ76_GEOBA|nr:Putative peptide transport system permease protein BMEII0209 [Geodia barretti]